jgi:hypothetical protein
VASARVVKQSQLARLSAFRPGGRPAGKEQPEEVFGRIRVHDKSLVRMTDAEGAGAHCHVGDQRYAWGKIFDWLDDRTPAKARQP